MEYGLGVGLAFIAAIGFGATAVLARIGMRHIRPTTGVFVSLVIGAIATMSIAASLHWKEIIGLGMAAFGLILLNAFLSYPGGRLFNFIGVRLAGASRASIIIGTSPLFTAGLAVWLIGEQLTVEILIGTVLIICGIGVILSSQSVEVPPNLNAKHK